VAHRHETFHPATSAEIEEIEASAAEADATADRLPNGRPKANLRGIAVYCRTIADIHRRNLEGDAGRMASAAPPKPAVSAGLASGRLAAGGPPSHRSAAW
jgi:hypothetical protein